MLLVKGRQLHGVLSSCNVFRDGNPVEYNFDPTSDFLLLSKMTVICYLYTKHLAKYFNIQGIDLNC
jgi:hypothetical protein